MSKDKQKLIFLGVLLVVLVVVVLNNFVLSDSGTGAPATTNNTVGPAQRTSSPSATAQKAKGRAGTGAEATPAEGYRPLPLDALGRRRSGDLEPDRNLFVYYIPPPPPPPPPRVEPPPPLTITAIHPSMVYAGQKEFTLEISGEQLPEDANIYLNNRPVSTSVESPTKLKALIQKPWIVAPGQQNVTVRTRSGLYSKTLVLNIQDPPKPNYSYIGRIDNLVFLAKSEQERVPKFLGDLVEDRWRVVEVTDARVMLEDVTLGISHPLGIAKSSGEAEGSADALQQRGIRSTQFRRADMDVEEDEQPPEVQPLPQQFIQQQPQQVPQQVPQQMPQQMPQQVPRPVRPGPRQPR
jgi:hypothetical protein